MGAQLAATKGSVAGVSNVGIALAIGGAHNTPVHVIAAGLVVGLIGYGVSLALFVLALRHLGTARTGAYFSIAPFVGAAVSLLLFREPIVPALAVAGVVMAAGVTCTRNGIIMSTTMTDGPYASHVHDEHHQRPRRQH